MKLATARDEAPGLVSSLTSVETCSEMRRLLSTTGVDASLTPNCFNSTVTLPRHRHREFAAGQELRRLAGNRRETGFGKRMHKAYPFERPELGLQVVERNLADYPARNI